MNLSNDWLKVATDRVFIVGVLDILFLIAPGVAVVYFFNPMLFTSLDWAKLTLLSIAVTAPLSFLNTVLAVALDGVIKENDLFGALSLAITCTGAMIYITLGVCYFLTSSFHDGAAFISILEVSFLMYATFRGWRQKPTK